MLTKYNSYDEKSNFHSRTQSAELDLDPPYDEQWPGWVLRVRRRRWTAVPVVEVCALLAFLVAVLSLSSTDLFWLPDPAPDNTPSELSIP